MDKRILAMAIASSNMMVINSRPAIPSFKGLIIHDTKANNIEFYQKQKHRKKKGGKINFK